MLELISLIILICSLGGMILIIIKKIPELLEFPEVSTVPLKVDFLSRTERIIRLFPPLREFSTQIFLQKILSKVRVLTLKTDHKTSTWLQSLRKKSQREKISENDNYWREIRKSTKEMR